MVIYSGLDEKRGGNQRGVAIGLSGVLRAAWKKEGTHTMVSERVLKIRMRLRDCYLTVLQYMLPHQ